MESKNNLTPENLPIFLKKLGKALFELSQGIPEEIRLLPPNSISKKSSKDAVENRMKHHITKPCS